MGRHTTFNSNFASTPATGYDFTGKVDRAGDLGIDMSTGDATDLGEAEARANVVNGFDPQGSFGVTNEQMNAAEVNGTSDLNGLDQQTAVLEAEVDATEAAEEAASQSDSDTGSGDGSGSGTGTTSDQEIGYVDARDDPGGGWGNEPYEGGDGGYGFGGYGDGASGLGNGSGYGCYAPIALDLDGDGVELASPDSSTAAFDGDGDGYRETTGWIGADDGVLAFDKDGDDDITDTDEISFVGYKEGATTDLEGLAAFDTNGDGLLSAADGGWNQCGVWQDADQDGEVDSGESQSLDAMGIESIGLSSDGVTQQQDGNIVYGTGSYSRTDGTTAALGDVGLGYVDPEAVALSLDDPRSAILEATNHFVDNASVFTGILGTSNNDSLTAGGQDSVYIYGGDGNDQLTGNSGHRELI